MVNKHKTQFLSEIPIASLDLEDSDLTERCKFNFSYFVGDAPGQEFIEWTHDDLAKLFSKLKEYSRYPLNHWRQVRVGKNGTVMTTYPEFPKNSSFKFPKHVPHQARWSRFRLEWAARLVGFVIPDTYHDSQHSCGTRFDKNTFYVVFLDKDHRFWKSEKK